MDAGHRSFQNFYSDGPSPIIRLLRVLGLVAIVAGVGAFAFSGAKLSDIKASVWKTIVGSDLQTMPVRSTKVFRTLGVAPRESFSDDVLGALTKLEREPCDKTAIYALTEAVATSDARWAGDALVGFAKGCGAIAVGDLRRASELYVGVAAYNEALAAANMAQGYDDADPGIYYVRGQALAGLQRWPEAISDYRRAISILGQPQSSESLNWDLVKALKAVGDFCGAVKALDEFIAGHPSYDLNQATSARADYRGRCVQPRSEVSSGQKAGKSPEDTLRKIVAIENVDADGDSLLFAGGDNDDVRALLTKGFRADLADAHKNHDDPQLDGNIFTGGASETDLRIQAIERSIVRSQEVQLVVHFSVLGDNRRPREKVGTYTFRQEDGGWKLDNLAIGKGKVVISERAFLAAHRKENSHIFSMPTDFDPAEQRHDEVEKQVNKTSQNGLGQFNYKAALGRTGYGRCHMSECSFFKIERVVRQADGKDGVMFDVTQLQWVNRGAKTRANSKVYCSKTRPAVFGIYDRRWMSTFLRPGDEQSVGGANEDANIFYWAACHAQITKDPVSRTLADRFGYQFAEHPGVASDDQTATPDSLLR